MGLKDLMNKGAYFTHCITKRQKKITELQQQIQTLKNEIKMFEEEYKKN